VSIAARSTIVPRGFGCVYHSMTIFCRAVPNLSITIRHFCIAVLQLPRRRSTYYIRAPKGAPKPGVAAGAQGQPEGARAYVDDLANKRFVSLRRLWVKRNREGVAPLAEAAGETDTESSADEANPALDLRILLDDVMQKNKPLDFQAVIESQPPLKVTAPARMGAPTQRRVLAFAPTQPTHKGDSGTRSQYCRCTPKHDMRPATRQLSP
jgi:hypothetical protein